ncbi:MAG: TonB-dependent receptor [Bacteroidales bacterium]
MKKIVFTSLIVFIALHLRAQSLTTDTLKLEEVVVSAPRLINYTTGAKVQRITDLTRQQNRANSVADMLNQATLASIKSYGVDGLTSVSLRGAGSNHTAVVWNGFSLQSPMNGGVDMSQLPAGFIEDVQVQYGGAGALYGSGAIGGVVHLNNTLQINPDFSTSVTHQLGSFHSYSTLASFKMGTESTGHALKIYHKSAENNFEFINTQRINSPRERTSNAAVKKIGILQSNAIALGKSKLETHLWYQFNDKEIPPNMFKATNQAQQEDEHFRGVVSFSSPWQQHNFHARAGIFLEKTDYYNPETTDGEPGSLSQAQSVRTEVENDFRVAEHITLNTGLHYAYLWSDASTYPIGTNQNRASIYSSLKLFSKNNQWASTLTLRQEFVDDHFTPFIPSLGLRYSPIKQVSFQANLARNYRLPTFNELYWGNWGNPDLQPEDGYSSDLGIKWIEALGNSTLQLGSTVFHSRIQDWIIWVPAQGKWSPDNVQKVWSRGVEVDAKWTYHTGQWRTTVNARYGFTRSTNEGEHSAKQGKQLMYVPQHETKTSATVRYKKHSFTYFHSYIGKRYITEDHSGLPIEAYHTGSVQLSTTLEWQPVNIRLAAHINNLWNASYQVMAFYPMPLRNYQFTIEFSFK